jgi:DNA-binding transcriptional LysR family regulator
MKTEQKNIYFWMMVFYEVVKQGNFTIAANNLQLTKSGVSQHVSRLEKHLGVQLLIRSTRCLSLTSAGEKIFKRSEEIKTLLDITIDEVNCLKEQPAGSLTITAPQALVPFAVLPAIKELIKQFPAIKPRLIIDDETQDIIKSGIDVAIRGGPLEDSALKVRKIGEDSEILIASSAYISSLDKPITLKNIHHHPFIATSWQTMNRSHYFIDKKQAHHELFLQNSIEVNSANTAIELVLLDLGIALLPVLYVKKLILEGKIQHVLNNLETASNDIYYLHAYKNITPLKVKWFLTFLMKWL